METLSNMKLTDEQVKKLKEIVQLATGMPYIEFAKFYVPNRLTDSEEWPDSYYELPEMSKE